MGKRKRTKPIRQAIVDQFEPFRKGFTHKYPLHEFLITDYKEYIEYISTVKSSIYLHHRDLALKALRIITGPIDPFSNIVELNHFNPSKVVLWDSKNLLEVAETENWLYLNEQIEKYGSLFIYFDYFAIFMLNTLRWQIDLERNKYYDAMLVKNADYIVNSPQTKKSRENNIELIHKAQRRLNRFAMNIFNKRRPNDGYKRLNDLEEFTYYTIRAVLDIVPEDIEELMLMMEREDKNIPYIPYRVAMQVKKAIPGHSDICNYDDPIETDAPVATNNNKDENSKTIFLDLINANDTSQVDDIYRAVRMTQYLNSISDPINKSIVQLSLKGFSPYEIATKLHISKSAIYERLIKLTPSEEN